MGASVTLERRSNHGGEGQTLADADEVEVEQVRPPKRRFSGWNRVLVNHDDLPRQARDYYQRCEESLLDKTARVGFAGSVLGEGAKNALPLSFLSRFYVKTIILPTQARDKHRESTQKRRRFVQVREVRTTFNLTFNFFFRDESALLFCSGWLDGMKTNPF